jgi:hypothetical protein
MKIDRKLRHRIQYPFKRVQVLHKWREPAHASVLSFCLLPHIGGDVGVVASTFGMKPGYRQEQAKNNQILRILYRNTTDSLSVSPKKNELPTKNPYILLIFAHI